jgi:hypothetical protein
MRRSPAHPRRRLSGRVLGANPDIAECGQTKPDETAADQRNQ